MAKLCSTLNVMLIMFDCDGVLVDSESISRRVLVELVSGFGMNMDPVLTEQRFVGRRLADCLAEVDAQLKEATGHALPPDTMERLREAEYVALAREVTEIPGVRSFLEALLGQEGAEICVASNGPREKIECTLGATGLREYFGDNIFSAYDTGVFKPDPHLYVSAAAALGHLPEKSVVVEDSVPGVRAGLAAGSHVIGYVPTADRSVYPDDERLRCIGNMDAAIEIVRSVKNASTSTGSATKDSA